MAVIESMAHVEEMLSKYEDVQCVSVIVIKGKLGLTVETNRTDREELVHVSEIGEHHVVYLVDVQGFHLLFFIQNLSFLIPF
jgi:hypothetical protein